MRARYVLLTAFGLSLTGCIAARGDAVQTVPPENPTAAAGTHETIASAASPQAQALEPPQLAAVPRPPQARPAPPAKSKPSQPFDPVALIGKSRNETVGMLGEPGGIRTEKPATIWRFSGAGCTLDVYFYMDLGVRELRALSYDVKADGKPASESAAADCVGRIRANRNERRRS